MATCNAECGAPCSLERGHRTPHDFGKSVHMASSDLAGLRGHIAAVRELMDVAVETQSRERFEASVITAINELADAVEQLAGLR